MEIKEILILHEKWLNGEGGQKAGLSYTDLRHTDLRHTDLSHTNLRHADLSHTDLRHAGLSYTDLRHTDLSYTDLSYTDLRHSDLSYTDLSHTDLSYTDLRHADLRHADLNRANLSLADLNHADLDFSCLPLWCGSLTAHFDDRQLKQIAYHLVKAGLQSKNASPEAKTELAKLIDFANGFHRVDECGKIEEVIKDE